MKFSIFFPVKPYAVTQAWGLNGEYYRDNGINIAGHNGLDLRVKHGQPVYASHPGTAYYQVDDKSGHGVIVISDYSYEYKDGDAYMKTIYWHLCDPDKEPQFKSPIPYQGTRVNAGDLLGYADNTGLSTGDHLHFGLKPMRRTYTDFYNIEQFNGYLGNIDPTPYLNGKYAEDLNTPFTHTFYTDMSLGMRSEEVSYLQRALQLLGYFPYSQAITGYYGTITKKAVFDFQKDYVAPKSWWNWVIVWTNFGENCHQLTRSELNRIFGVQQQP